MCAVDTYKTDNILIPDDSSSGGGRPMPITTSKGSLILLDKTINVIDNWIQLFKD